MSRSPVFPQDLVDSIIDNLRDDIPSLRQCSLVSSAWRSTAQRELHRTIILKISLTKSQGSRFSNRINHLLGPSLHLLQHARTLVICWRADVDPEDYPQKTREEPSLITFLKKLNSPTLPQLSCLELRNIIWGSVNKNLRYAFLRAISSEAIHQVRLIHCGLPSNLPWLRFVGPETRKITLSCLIFLPDDAVSLEDARQLPLHSVPKLTILKMQAFWGRTSGMVNWILRPPSHDTSSLTADDTPGLRKRASLKHVTTLSFTGDRESIPLFDEITQACPSLTTLKFKPWLFNSTTNGGTGPLFPNLARSASLQSLHIHGLWTDSFPWLASSIKTLSTWSSPEKTIAINMKTQQTVTTLSTENALLKQVRNLDAVIIDAVPGAQVSLTLTLASITDDFELLKTAFGNDQARLSALKVQIVGP
ncbi:hypothetical protein ONZ45_g3914 [Pleurotus djamor]|nr:hypothetical protein ONZ45_g3914 [Pleurotus djamor]